MSNSWQTHLIEDGAQLVDGVMTFDPMPSADSDTPRVYDLGSLGLIGCRGVDAEDFLQGQLTNDVRELSPTHSQLSGHCSHKGRLLACGRLWRQEGGYLWQLPSERIAPLLKRLGLFVLRAQLELEDASARWARMGYSGRDAVERLAALGLRVPEHANGVLSEGTLTLIRIPDPVPRIELVGPPERLMGLWDALAEGAERCDARAWRQRDLLAGIAQVYDATAEIFVPQMLNLQLIDGVSFTKGCYTGQEVVARMQHLGTLKRRMFLAEVERETAPRPGEMLHSEGSQSRQASGWVVDTSPLDAEGGRHLLLAVAEIDAVEAGRAVRLGEQGAVLRFRDLPY
ncbi:MAG: folate-binding protein YgfZ, partial [Chromatiaceae bacterium]|nr:folate-binding protein YgfZ [Chromatiaceae bacterium]